MDRIALAALCALLVSCVSAQGPSANKVTSVPGFDGSFPFNMYAGYLPANDGEKQMFYMFAQSQGNPKTDPVVLWLNGGPGCSSFDGFIYEHGPFFFNNGPMGADQNLTLNPYSWNLVANMIYLDSPCGVGLSYSTNPDDYITNDTVTAHDSHNFLLNFFNTYSSFKTNDFYIAGESYAGIYVPTLAQQVAMGNSNPKTFINLKGILVGNGVTDANFDGNAFIPFAAGHALISQELNSEIQAACGDNTWNNSNTECNNLVNEAESLTAALNIYNIYLDCYNGPELAAKRHVSDLWYRVTERAKRMAVGGSVPCINADRATAWVNQNSVRTALHAIPVSQQEWQICTDLISYESVYSTVIPIHQQLLNDGYRILIYSGDVDMCVPNTGSEAWTSSLDLPEVEAWRPWLVNSQIAGYVHTYKGLTYATIKGSGHTVPQYKPAQAYHFFSSFLNETPF
eukprot:TRINITY_DN1004_c0_g1_i1.p1 TRINITY_DN1004_c0_g1~~TRINITY_DN1004_c0_g1_i1.p1  ORF type:complete len:455 (+),score=85.88 TRINITY_DN1004_c0_g1_i1:152-1516(+)